MARATGLGKGTSTRDLKWLSRRMAQLASDIEPGTEAVLREVAVVANQTLVMATPVDKARARANWQVSIGAPIDTATESTDAQGQMARNVSVIEGYRGGSLYIQNNVPYIQRLNDGWSAQAPAGFVEKALQRAASAVSRRQRKLVR